ncbi:MAG: cytochrome c [Planctomycetes bacterium]|nr:cytochrome c [Planctomycetota bacterium]
MTKILPLAAFALLAPIVLVGCGSDGYSSAIVYGVRTDPLVLDDKLGKEGYEPDRPGVLPILLAKDVDNPFNPMYEKGASLFKDGLLRDPTKISDKDRRTLSKILQAYFGRPGEPQVAGVDSTATRILKLDQDTLSAGSQLYRLHCLHCHGLAGDGRGPTGRWVNPHPRDYRLGLFKFTSVDQSDVPRPPSRGDLYRTLQTGIDGTAMPAFNMLTGDDLQNLVSYIIHLSLRGKVEFETIKKAFDYDPAKGTLSITEDGRDDVYNYIDAMVSEFVSLFAKDWVESQTKTIAAPSYPYADFDKETRAMTAELKESIQRGQKLFLGEGADKAKGVMPSKEEAKKANCVSCHIDYGRQARYKFDAWGTLVKAQNLTNPIRRGGDRPIDVFYRIHSGINGSGMVAHSKLEPNHIWDLVNFVQTLPFPAMRKAAGIEID